MKEFMNKLSRQRLFKQRFQQFMLDLKQKHGSGEYSWAEGINRKIARRIARDMARRPNSL